MKGNAQVIDRLNFLLADEVSAISQYMVHSEMCANWGFGRLHEAVEKRAMDEMKHAEMLIARILFLEGQPVAKTHGLQIGVDVPDQLKNDWDAEAGAIKAYNEAIAVCVAQSDNGTRALLESILKDEEDHIDWLEAQKDQIGQMGLQVYLGHQLE